jgi:ABC-type molybdate transport system substrate-binding protein
VPLRQRMVRLRDARPAAADFQTYLASPEARRIFAAHGFGAPPADN